ncbi:DUF5693 family protein [Cohnella panacarvi]|uniref:DUF5693 family protein n=1 Tax=Cohnella panacarvi TaxID=400776 RepID=UPI00047EDA04|nr:DUF5693 family protein [Cohnella panacarvi]
MPQWLNRLNGMMSKWLWWVVIVGLIAALPVMYARAETESSSKNVAIVMDYRDLLQVSSTQKEPQAYVQEQLLRLREAGVNGMAVFESTLEELSWAGEINVYNAAQAALLEQRVSPPEDNRTYLIFHHSEHEKVLRPIIEWAFTHYGADVRNWTAGGLSGLSIGMGYDDALIHPMEPNPIAMQELIGQGFQVYPRLSNRILPYDAAEVKIWLDKYQALGVKRVLFDGEAVTGWGEGTSMNGVKQFADMLDEHGLGVAMFENLKVPVKGLSKVANLLEFDAIRGHSISEGEMTILKTAQIEDRLVLAVKDRNIRLIYLNALAARDAVKGLVYHPLDKIVDALGGTEDAKGVIGQLEDFGYAVGEPAAFEIHTASAGTVFKGLAALGAIALCAIMIGQFIPALLSAAFAIGAVGFAGLYVLKPDLMAQTLALFTAIAAPTTAVILLVKKLRELRDGDADLSVARRLGGSLLLFVRTTILSLAAIPFMVALLDDITYSLVLQQFRGVSLLHLAPIALVALYVFLYGSNDSVLGNARRILAMPLTVLWIVGLGIIAAGGLYYLSRTGNAGEVSGLELQFRSLLENAFGVRPRTKEFLLGHPLFLAGIFLALRYRWAMALIIAGTIAQLSMVDTFAHIHTPMLLSAIRVLLGLGLGLIIGLIAIAAWQIVEGAWTRWVRRKA